MYTVHFEEDTFEWEDISKAERTVREGMKKCVTFQAALQALGKMQGLRAEEKNIYENSLTKSA